MCPVTTTSSLVKCLWPYTVMFINTQLYFDNQVSCLIRGWRFHQVLSLKYFFNGAIAPDASGGYNNFEQRLAPLDNRDYSFNVCE